MSDTVQVEAARIPDRDRLLAALRDNGLDARAVNEVAIEVVCADGDGEQAGDEVYAHVEDLIMDVGAHFVPIKHEQVIYIRPPLS